LAIHKAGGDKMKIRIELNEEMQKEWMWAKEDLDAMLRLFKKGHTETTDTVVLQCLLHVYMRDRNQPRFCNSGEKNYVL
jgi:hypothetical protein